MLFPESQRVIYANNPLVEVVCQLRFPPILRIDAELPAAFQDLIRNEYPHFKESRVTELRVDLPPEVVQLSGGAIPPTLRAGKVAYDFISADKQWKVGLTRDFIALSTEKYERWEDFKQHLAAPLAAFIKVYAPQPFLRVGLRYRDVIRRSRLGLSHVPWAELLQPHVAGELAAPGVAEHIIGVAKQIHFRLPDSEGEAVMQHGFVEHPDEEEICYLSDIDFSTSTPTEVNDVIPKLDAFNQEARRFFHWFITDRLDRALGPQSI